MAKEKIDKRNAKRAVSTKSKTRTSKAAGSKKTKRKSRPPRSVRQAQSQQMPTKLRSQGFGVSVTLQVPSLKLPPKITSKLPLWMLAMPRRITPRLPRKIIAGLVVLVLITSLVGVRVFHHNSPKQPTQVTPAELKAPDFKPLIPSAAEASTQVFDGKRDTLSYSTTFSGARLTVSQQPLPKRFTLDPKALQAAADSIHAKQRIDTAKGPLYIATNETKDQLAVFAGTQVLLFIHSDRQLDDASWKAFIELLKEKS